MERLPLHVYFPVHYSPMCSFTSAVLTPAVCDVSDRQACVGFTLSEVRCPFRKVPRLRGVDVDSPAFNVAVIEYGGGTCVELGCTGQSI
jgi:hypothetical protein